MCSAASRIPLDAGGRSYIFNDRNRVQCGACGVQDCAASILACVVSTSQPGQIIIDCGSKTFSSDPSLGGNSFGHIVEAPEAVFHTTSEEHGWIDVSSSIPNHICPTVNEHDVAYGFAARQVEEIWRVEAKRKAALSR